MSRRNGHERASMFITFHIWRILEVKTVNVIMVSFTTMLESVSYHLL